LERLPDLAAELVHLPVDVIQTATSWTIRAAQQATRTIPIVMGNSQDLVSEGFVASLARPGGNITGLTLFSPDLASSGYSSSRTLYLSSLELPPCGTQTILL
jgi:putative tryptophan/tyrosine transport system substrate-binding protein